MADKPSWQQSRFAEEHSDPLSGFANIMDVMLVFAVGLMLALVSQSESLQAHFELTDSKTTPVTTGKELTEVPQSIQQQLGTTQGDFQSLGQVYQDPQTGKLILIQQGQNSSD